MSDIIQGTPEWHDQRRGKITASNIKCLWRPDLAGYEDYLFQLALERATGKTEESYSNFDMQRGTELEPQARTAYELKSNQMVSQISFMDHPSIPMTGASPDGLLEDGMVEFKCPKSKNHFKYYNNPASLEKEYINQVQWQMACNPKAKYVDLVSYHPSFPEISQLVITRVVRDDKLIKELEDLVIDFNKKVDETAKIIIGGKNGTRQTEGKQEQAKSTKRVKK